jgi:hypothetical protein
MNAAKKLKKYWKLLNCTLNKVAIVLIKNNSKKR